MTLERHSTMKTPFKNATKPFKNAPSASRAQGDVHALQALLGAFSREF